MTDYHLTDTAKLRGPIRAVVFDLDGVLIDSGSVWERAVKEFVKTAGGTWRDLTPEEAMAGGNSDAWAAWFKDKCRLPLSLDEVRDGVIDSILAQYRVHLPLIPGAADTVRRLAAHFRLGLASAAPAPVIELVLEASGLAPYFTAWVSADEVPEGKPNPQVYIECCRRLELPPTECVAVEDSPDGLRAARAAGLFAVAVPPVHPSALRTNHTLADVMVGSVREVTPGLLRCLGAPRQCRPGRGIVLRPAMPGDYEAISRLLEGNDLSSEGIMSISEDGGALMVAAAADTIVGCGGLKRYGQLGLLWSLAVSPGFRRRGIGSSLVEALLLRAKQSGIRCVYALTTGAADYLVRLGFQPIPRADAPAPIRSSHEFTSLCPAGAVLLAQCVPSPTDKLHDHLPHIP